MRRSAACGSLRFLGEDGRTLDFGPLLGVGHGNASGGAARVSTLSDKCAFRAGTVMCGRAGEDYYWISLALAGFFTAQQSAHRREPEVQQARSPLKIARVEHACGIHARNCGTQQLYS